MEELAKVYIYTQKVLTLITSKIYFCKFSSLQIAFSIIHLSREKYLNKKLKNSYEVTWKGFKRNHLVAYKEEVNKIFDELHPY